MTASLSGCPGCDSRRCPKAQGRAPTIEVLVNLSTLLGLDDAPAELAGYGAITAEHARRLAADATGTRRRLVLDPQRQRLLDYGSRVYRPPQPLADHVISRDGQCAFPSCHQDAQRCDLDHVHPFEQGGPTNPENLAPLCRRHHIAKTEGVISYVRTSDGCFHWLLSTGEGDSAAIDAAERARDRAHEQHRRCREVVPLDLPF